MKTKIFAGAVLAFGSLLAACGPGAYVGVGYGPPPPRYGVVGVAPGPAYVWTDGFWDWRGGGWVWAPGRWMRPPHPGAHWEPGRWDVRGGRGYRFHRGHWR